MDTDFKKSSDVHRLAWWYDKVPSLEFFLFFARALTVHKSQGRTFKKVVFEYNKSLDQQLVYVGLSRVQSIEGLFLTNCKNDHRFYHGKSRPGVEKIVNLRNELNRLENYKFETLDHGIIEKITEKTFAILNLDVRSLRAHSLDILWDEVLMKASLFCFVETRLPNGNEVGMDGLDSVTQNKRETKHGGVAIDKKKNLSISPQKRPQPILDGDDFGDIAFADILIHDQKVLMVSVYINPPTTMEVIQAFLKNTWTPCLRKKIHQCTCMVTLTGT